MRRPSIPPPVLVGREAELARIERALENVTVGLIVGVAGVGKSALLDACAASGKRQVVALSVRPGQSMEDVVDDARRALARGRVRQVLGDEERFLDLVNRLERSEALLLIDDLHHLGGAAHALLASLGGALENARVVAASRERALDGPRDPLRFELRLENLDETRARSLWTLLDDLYGAKSGFERAWERTRGNPLLLRRAHAGDLDAEDPIAAALDKLEPDERFAALALALAETPLPRALLTRLLPEQRGLAALRSLVQRLIVVMDGNGAASLHDSFREPLSRNLDRDEENRLHSALADVLDDLPGDLVARVRQCSRHLAEAGRFDDLAGYLRSHAKALVQHGASRELAEMLEIIPDSHKSRETETLRARALARSLDLHRAFLVLERLTRERGETDREVLLTFARVATLMGRLELAESTLAPLLAEGASDDQHGLRLLTAYALLATHLGRGDEVRRRLAAAEARAADPLARAIFTGYRAVSFWLDERDAEASDVVAKTRALGAEVLTPSVRAGVGIPYGLAASLARTGKLEEAEELLERSRGAGRLEEDALLSLELRLVAAEVAFHKGERLAALAELETLATSFSRGGYLLAELWSNVFRARVLRVLGRAQAAARLEAVSEDVARQHGVEAVLRAIGRSRDATAPGLDDGVRNKALQALAAGSRGDAESVAAIEASIAPRLAVPGYGLDRALLLLARSLAADARGKSEQAETIRREALALAAAENADPDALFSFVPSLGALRVVSTAGPRIAGDVDLSEARVVIDARDHTLRVGEAVISLKTRHVLRRLLYGFAREPGRCLGKERLAELAWGVEYDPRVHDGALKVNVLRLRALLRDTGLSIDLDVDGYRLEAPPDLVFVEPLNAE